MAGCCNEERQRWPVRVMPNIGAYEEMLLKLANIMLESAVPATAVPAAAAAASVYSYYCCTTAATAATAVTSATTASGSGANDRIPI